MNGEAMIAKLAHLEAKLAAKGFPAMSPWWRDTLVRFYLSRRRQLVLRVGRRGGKSSTLCRVAVLEAVWGEHKIPPGDVGVVALISVSRDESAGRLRTIAAILSALGVHYDQRGETIELRGRPVVFKTFAASVSGVVGFTAISVICDEVARWRDSDTGANPAKEVLASLRPTMATMPSAKLFLSSSPFGTEDAHYEAFEQGETDFSMPAWAPSWVANNTISEEETRKIEPDTRAWLREFYGQPQSAVSAALDEAHWRRAFRPPPPHRKLGRIIALDPSSGRHDLAVATLAGWAKSPTDPWKRDPRYHDGRWYVSPLDGKYIPNPDHIPTPQFLSVDAIHVWEPAVWFTSDTFVASVVQLARQHGVGTIVSDQRENFALASAFAARGLRFVSFTWTNKSKTEAVELLRRWFADDRIILPDDPELRKELAGYSERITPTGLLVHSARGSGRDDRVSSLLTLCMAETAGLLPSSPMHRPRIIRDLSNLRPA